MSSQIGAVAIGWQIYDMTGRLISTIENNMFEDENNEVIWETNEVKPGIYFLKMKRGSYSATKRISVIK